MALAVRSETSSGAPTTFATGAGTQTSDLLVFIAANNYYTAADIQTPTTSGTWTLRLTYDSGTNTSHAKVWTSPGTSGNATVTSNWGHGDEERYGHLFVISGTPSYDTSGSNGSASTATAHVAPSVTPADTTDLLICTWGFQGNGEGDTNYTVPGSMTATTEQDVASTCTYRSAYEVLASGAATGTRTATAAATRSLWFGLSVLIKPPASAGKMAPALTRRQAQLPLLVR
jgi:hypothetical protein